MLFRPEVDFIGTNPDLRCPTAFGFVPDCGGICAMLQAAVNRAPHYIGKPNAEIVALCTEQVDANPDEVLVVGERLYTDIACGIYAGVETALVYTGEAKAVSNVIHVSKYTINCESGGCSFYITNNSVKSRKDYVEKFRRWGL